MSDTRGYIKPQTNNKEEYHGRIHNLGQHPRQRSDHRQNRFQQRCCSNEFMPVKEIENKWSCQPEYREEWNHKPEKHKIKTV